MATKLTAEAVTSILSLLSANPDGVTAAAVRAALPSPPDERTVERWLALIVEGGRAVVVPGSVPARYQPPPPAAPPPPPPAAEPEPETPANTEATYAEMLQLALPVIVGGCMNRLAVTLTLQKHARRNGLTGLAADAYLAYSLQRLGALTASDVAAFGISPETFRNWHSVFTTGRYPGVPATAPGAAAAN